MFKKSLSIVLCVLVCLSVLTMGVSATNDEQGYAIDVALDKDSMSLNVGASGKLTATVSPSSVILDSVKWESSDKSIATVDNEGNVKANSGITSITQLIGTDLKNLSFGKTGTTTITVTAKSIDGTTATATCKVTVKMTTLMRIVSILVPIIFALSVLINIK